MALSQEDYMRAIVGSDDRLWKPMPSFFTPGTPVYTEEGGEVLKGPRDFDSAKRMLAKAAIPINRSPASLRSMGEGATCGGSHTQQVEAEVAAWFEANAFEAEKAGVRRLNKAAFDHVVYAPLGFYLGYQAWRKNVTGIVQGPYPLFWGVSKTA